ncbi:MAG: hypothetical protein HWE22_11915 [Flavobacteriales bacterium]|nr:hypothetical protein [Flavobacteriales bacterium]
MNEDEELRKIDLKQHTLSPVSRKYLFRIILYVIILTFLGFFMYHVYNRPNQPKKAPVNPKDIKEIKGVTLMDSV